MEIKKNSMKIPDDLDFGFIPSQIVSQVLNSLSSKDKYFGVKALEDFVNSLESLHPIYASLSQFMPFMVKILEETHFKISLSCISILNSIVSDPEILNSEDIQLSIPLCVKKLGDNKISVRQAAHKFFRKLIKGNTKKVVQALAAELDCSNWHIKEEVVAVLIVTMLTLPGQCDYLSLVPSLAKMLDDNRTKIRMVGTEALAVVASIYGEKKVNCQLVDIVDDNALEIISERFNNKHLPVLTDEYLSYSKDITKTYRGISSPYLPNTPTSTLPASFSASVTYEKFIPETPTSAETSLEPHNTRKNFSGLKSLKFSTSSNSAATLRQISEFNPTYIPFSELEPIPCPSEGLQRCIFHTENWLEQFETVNTIRKLVKNHPEVFLSKVTLHNIILNLSKWADSLRSALSKNSLIALKEICEHLGKTVDGEISCILKVFFKKAADTNTFLSQTACEGLDSLCKNCSEGKILVQLAAENSKNPGVKAKLMDCIAKILQKTGLGALKMKDIDIVIQRIVEYLTDASPDVRSSAKEAFDILIDNISNENNLNTILNLAIKETSYRKIKDAIRKKSKPMSTVKLSSKDLKITLPSLSKSLVKKNTSASARDLIHPILHNESEELKKIQAAESGIMNIEWKTRYQAISISGDLLKTSYSSIETLNKITNLIEIFQKGLTDMNLKVIIHTLTYLIKVIPAIKDLDKHINLLLEPLVICLGSSNSSIRDVAWDACILITLHIDNDLLVPLITSAVSKTSPRGKTAVITVLNNLVGGVKDKVLLEKFVLNLVFKFIDDPRLDIRTEVTRLLITLYKILGNHIIDNIPTSKMHKVINLISNKLD
jgi:CLASP N terminal